MFGIGIYSSLAAVTTSLAAHKQQKCNLSTFNASLTYKVFLGDINCGKSPPSELIFTETQVDQHFSFS